MYEIIPELILIMKDNELTDIRFISRGVIAELCMKISPVFV